MNSGGSWTPLRSYRPILKTNSKSEDKTSLCRLPLMASRQSRAPVWQRDAATAAPEPRRRRRERVPHDGYLLSEKRTVWSCPLLTGCHRGSGKKVILNSASVLDVPPGRTAPTSHASREKKKSACAQLEIQSGRSAHSFILVLTHFFLFFFGKTML